MEMLLLTIPFHHTLPSIEPRLYPTLPLHIPLPSQRIRGLRPHSQLLWHIRAEVLLCFQIFCLTLAGKLRSPIRYRLVLNDLCDIAKLGVSEGELAYSTMEVGGVEGKGVEA